MNRWFSLLFIPLLLLTACGVRGPNSPYVSGPFDPDRETAEQQLNTLLTSQEIQLNAGREYTIGPGDVIGLTLVGRPDILGEDQSGERFQIAISDSPAITLPLIGAIRVHGKTKAQLESELKTAYSSYIQNPVPIVTLERMHYNTVAVLGAVKEPGRYPLEPGDTLLEGIFRAGGLTFGGQSGGPPPGRYLKVYREKVTRKDRSQLELSDLLDRIREGEKLLPREELVVPLESFIFSGDLEYNIPLAPNDVIFIPPAGTVIVMGHLKDPGVVFLGPSVRNLSHAITERRGMRWGGASRVEIVREDREAGEQVSYFRNIRKIMKRDEPDFVLQDNDQVFVHRHPIRAPLEAFANIFRASVSGGASATYNPVN